MDTPSTVKFQMAITVLLVIGAAYWLVNLFAADDPMIAWVALVMLAGTFGVMFAVNGIKQGLKKAKVSKGMNLFLTLTACFILPTALTVAIIYGGIALSGSSSAEDASNLPDLRYDIVTVKIPILYNWYKEEMYHDRDETKSDVPIGHRNLYRPIDPGPWGAKEAYRLYCEEGWWHNTYLLCYGSQIVEITFGWEPTADDMAIVSQKLNP